MSIRFTHGYNLLWKLLSFATSLALIAGLSAFFSPYLDRVVLARAPQVVMNWTPVVLFLLGWLLVYVLLLLTVLPPWLPDMLYVRWSLQTAVTTAEAEKVAFLFDGSMQGRWYRLDALRRMDRDLRRDFLFRFANDIARKQGRSKPFRFPEEEPRQQSGAQAGAGQKAGAQAGAGAQQSRIDPTQAFLRLLGLTSMPASQEELKAAYRGKISAFHPDRFTREKPEVRSYAEEMSKRINLAYRWLYDRMRGTA